ncbi:uncharacterized protein LOC126368328 [Pectinophora gossypiella]|uniref:uncharacterized protein LOC126368328 n=1 Tax=Pectinophora gossypiella TaxID=13191 RepID=UPI00214F2E40|nr:uncharacterized protein LOC126368328 [Pectinophora gossypiella]
MLLLVFSACLVLSAAHNATHDATTPPPPSDSSTTKEILKASETADPSKVEIVKQIRRLNEDGSYTIGYEADDGTFKIESRDVLGNVKGTFGYVDKDGEIKRVTYSSSSDATPVPVSTTTTSTTPSTPMMVVRVNKTVSSTTRRPLGTVVYPTRSGSSYTTRGTVVQPIPRRRMSTTSTKPTTSTEMTTEKQQAEESTSNILNLYKPKIEESGVRTRTQMQKPISVTVKDDLITRQTTTKLPQTVKPVYEHVTEEPENDPGKANTIRRELTGTSPNPHMISLQQSAGDDSTDVYGSHLSLGTVRPLFTTTTPRPRLVPIHSLVAARQKIHQQYQEVPVQEQETTIEASTGRVFDRENVVTSNPVPVIQIPTRIPDDRLYQQPIYRRPQSAVHFRTTEYLRDNPGAPVPIGNQRPFLQYEYQNKILEPQYVKEVNSPPQTKASAPEAATASPYDARQVTRIIPIAVDERGVPIQGYQRFVNAYRPVPSQPPPLILQPQPRYDPIEEMNSISAPVSTRDLKRLLQILILRQNRLQALMDQIVAPGPPYQPLPLFKAEPQYDYNRYQNRQYPDDERYDYRYDQQQYRQQDMYQQNQVSNYDPPQYESQRYVPRRRLYTRPYDTASASSNRVDETQEYLPAEIREALLLKMLMLAISPDFMPSPAPPTELTTAAPPRKQVRNVQILGEEGSMDEAKRAMQRH